MVRSESLREEPLSTGQTMQVNIGRVATGGILKLVDLLAKGASTTTRLISHIAAFPWVLLALSATLGRIFVLELVLWIVDRMVQYSLALKGKSLPKGADSQ